ncbi:GTP-binding protein [Burkholderia cenocepacia]|uniref:GTP-binding protein n=1 Tax=Burkholderia cenocepacia TaxID=95486 RepID=UPI002AAFC81F|nr:GTP-binding protein [Burkholderia cenocepacia]
MPARLVLRAKGIVCVADAEGAIAARVWQVAAARMRFSSMEDDGPSRRDGVRVIVFIGIIGRVTETALRGGIVHCSVAADMVATTSNVD